MLLPARLRGRDDLYMVKLQHRFDPARIKRDVLPKITDDLLIPKNQEPGDGKIRLQEGVTSYHSGGWLSLGLVPPAKKSLKDFPYVKEMIEWFKSPEVYRVRLLVLEAGHKINPHCGNLDAVEKVRLLIPMQITPQTVYKCGPYDYTLDVGEIWYLNQVHIHSVENNSQERRTVLAIDLLVNDRVKELFQEVGYLL